MHNIFFRYNISKIVILDEKSLKEILEYLEKSINNLAKDTFESLEIEGGFSDVEYFLQTQYDIRLENLLVAKNSSIHYLESSMKNKIIQRKQKIFSEFSKRYKN